METSKASVEKGTGGRKGGDKKMSVSRSKKVGLPFLVARIIRYLNKGRYSKKVDTETVVYIAIVMEYLATEVHIHGFLHIVSL